MKQNSSEKLQHVGIFRRFAAIFYDGFLLIAVLFFASLIIIIPLGITFEHPLYSVYVAYIYAVAFIYFGWFWTHNGQTLGMKTWSIQVRQVNGELISWKQALLRYSSALLFWIPAAAGGFLFPNYFQKYLALSLVPIAADYITCLFDPEQRALHDIISRTRLVLANNQNH